MLKEWPGVRGLLGGWTVLRLVSGHGSDTLLFCAGSDRACGAELLLFVILGARHD